MSNVHITQVLLDFDRAIASGKRIGDTIDQVSMTMMMVMMMVMVMAMTMVLMLNATTMMTLTIYEQQLQPIFD
jgi:hypothetical protein